ncbi:uncharacterized protein LOC124653291 isoform X2 [Lolium rigidum]|uniref:uncharacterized protein LOC124653291 isoform X2 n=1 Tax=Lolium rigidum TaxID=89674 RepID=UPI001F5C3310|nr:uncharacterized protein LOC124653291 isoform X2 [Lolium rigidum]
MASQGHSIVAVVFVDRCCQLFHIQRHRREEAVQNVKVQLPAIPRIIESKSIWQLAYEFRSCRCSPQQPGTSWPCSLTLFVLEDIMED